MAKHRREDREKQPVEPKPEELVDVLQAVLPVKMDERPRIRRPMAIMVVAFLIAWVDLSLIFTGQ